MNTSLAIGEELAEYLERPLEPPPAAVLEMIERGPCEPHQVVAVSGLERLLDPTTLPVENGWCWMEDGTGFAAVRTEMPEVDAGMVDWWFDWHPWKAERYRVWHPLAHIGNSVDLPDVTLGKPLWGAVHHAVEDIGDGPMNARIEFVDPAGFGFPAAALSKEEVGTVICANVSDHRARHSLMTHVFLRAERGLVLRSHFWLGSVIRPRLPRPLDPVGRLLEPALNTKRARRHLLPDSTPKNLARHCAEEYTHLAAILPQLYDQFKDEERA